MGKRDRYLYSNERMVISYQAGNICNGVCQRLATAVRDRFGAGTDDPTLIQWLGLQTGIWITRDKKAKSKHAAEIENSQIHIAWIRFPTKNKGLSMKDQLLLVLWCIDDILEQMVRARQPARFLLYYNGQRPKWDRL